MAGWISLHRKIMDNPIYSNANMLKLWIHCLMKATHTKRDQLIGNQLVKLEVGEFVTGRHALADEFNKGTKKDEIVSDRTLWRWMKNFEEWEMLSIKSTTKYSVITVKNWSEHQQRDQPVSSSRPADDQPVSTNNNVNNSNNGNKEDDKGPVPLNPFQFYEQEGFGTLSSFIADQLGDLIDSYGEEKLLAAMKETVLNGARNLKYVKAVLNNPKASKPKGVTRIGTNQPSNQGSNEQQSRIREANERRKRIAGI